MYVCTAQLEIFTLMMWIDKREVDSFGFKVIPWFCIAYPYCARFSRH